MKNAGVAFHLALGLTTLRCLAAADPPAIQELPQVDVVGNMPLPDSGTPRAQIPANVQTAAGADIDRQKPLDVADFINQNLNGVFINETQDNPFQPDVNFRGFTASPLLGAPEGLSVYVDGVRVNESFGDIVNWDLIPESAIAGIVLMPGSNPLFGLNALGGALSVQTRNGAEYPGTLLSAYGGSFGRRDAEFSTGGARSGFDYYFTGNWFDEDGWRVASPSHLRQLFGNAGWQDKRSDIHLSYTYADSNLTGNGVTPENMIASLGQASVFTVPDNTRNHLDFINARGSRWLRDDLLLTGHVYFRQLRARTLNGDANDDYADDYEQAIAAGGSCAAAPDPDSCAATAFADETAVDNRTETLQRTDGTAAQLRYGGDLFGRRNQLTVGASYDDGRSDFTQTAQNATFSADRSTVADGEVAEDVSLYGTNRSYGFYTADTYSLNALVHATAAARYNNTRVHLEDRLGTDLNGDHGFHRLNPALGVNLTPGKRLTLYLDYNEGSRTPTAIELGCADPAQPCKLPNAFAGDPPLQQVIARTWEAGARGALYGKALQWSGALFHTTSDNDIQFISSNASGAGYFSNVGRTLRQGAELSLSGERGRFAWQAGYSYVDATYRTPLSLVSPDNSTADANGSIDIASGARIPEIPRHNGKLEAGYDVTGHWRLGANLLAESGSFVRGNENNQHQPGVNAQGSDYQDAGGIGDFVVLNLNSAYDFAGHWQLFARIDNVLDRHYATAGQLSSNPFDNNGHFMTNPADWTQVTAISPAAPRAIWAGLQLRLD